MGKLWKEQMFYVDDQSEIRSTAAEYLTFPASTGDS